MTEYQMPSAPMTSGSSNTAPTSKTSVRRNAMSAETRPLPSAVKSYEPYMLMPMKHSANA